MQKERYTAMIHAPAGMVYDKMLGISSKSDYEQWTSLFNPTSTYDGNWEEGSKMLFIGEDEQGEKGGMVSRIVRNIPGRFISIQHYGLYKADKEITEGPEVEKWANAYENYLFEENNGTTTVTVEMDINEEYLEYFNEAYPKALGKLKEICEE